VSVALIIHPDKVCFRSFLFRKNREAGLRDKRQIAVFEVRQAVVKKGLKGKKEGREKREKGRTRDEETGSKRL
jgi:hypothetical protein